MFDLSIEVPHNHCIFVHYDFMIVNKLSQLEIVVLL